MNLKLNLYASLICLSLTLLTYVISLVIYRRYKKPWLNPLYTTTISLLLLAHLLHIQSRSFQQSSTIVNQLLQLGIVALAIPLFKQWSTLKKDFKKIGAGVISGTLIGILSVISLAQIFHVHGSLLASLIPRSVTLPIALTVSSDLGGMSSMTILFVVISGLVSLILGPKLLVHLGITSKAAKGLAMGTSAQMLGASQSLIWGEEEGAMGSVAMTSTALLYSLLVPILPLLLKLS